MLVFEVNRELLLDLLVYDEETGLLYWKPRDTKYFANPKRAASWNSKWAGKVAGSRFKYPKSPCEYIRIRIFKQNFRAHRLIWCMVYGEFPEFDIDHEDHNGLNNRINNLREATDQENQKNLSMRKDNTSGITGVRKSRNGERFVATIQHIGKVIYIGTFPSLEAATEARLIKEKEFGFHNNHGKR